MPRLTLLIAFVTLSPVACAFASEKADGYGGIWFTLGQRSEHGDKYSGGLGTYTANHVPIAIRAPKVNKTFFVYGGTKKGERHLLIMASYYDQATGKVPRPTIVHDKGGVNDPHDNAAIALDDDGHVWVFVSGRARVRKGFIYRSREPYSVNDFEKIDEREMTYPQPRFVSGQGFFYLFTKYTKGRELYWQTSRDGRTWENEQKLAGFGGHYQVSGVSGDGQTIGTAFMWHPNGKLDARTNLYYVQTRDFGKTWTTVDGKTLQTPLASEKNDALLIDYQSQGFNVYIHDLNFDPDGKPAILYLTSKGHQPGPQNGPRVWWVTRWDGSAWRTSKVCESDHNYDTGCLVIDRRAYDRSKSPYRWSVIGPMLPGPQPHGTGGDVRRWQSDDGGSTWQPKEALTERSRYNHSYVRRVVDPHEPCMFFWADGDPNALSESRLYIGGLGRSWVLPYDMDGEFAELVPQGEQK